MPSTDSPLLAAADLATEHARALTLAHDGRAHDAADVLQEALRAVIDPEPINDLAVLASRVGESDYARDLLRAVVRLYPDHTEAAENLAALAPEVPMAYYAKDYDNAQDCPADRDIAGYLDRYELTDGGLTVFHFGTGAHHHVGLANHRRPRPNHVIAVTASPGEYARYMELCLQDGALGRDYLVFFGDIYNLRPEFLPPLDVASMPHVGEYYAPSAVQEAGATAGGTDRSGYAPLNDPSLVELIVDKLVVGGRLLIYVHSRGAGVTQPILHDLVRERRRLSYQMMHGSIAVFTKLK